MASVDLFKQNGYWHAWTGNIISKKSRDNAEHLATARNNAK